MTRTSFSNQLPGGFSKVAFSVGLIVLLLLITAVELVIVQEQQRQRESEHREVTSQAGEVRALLESELNATLYLASGIRTYIQARGGRLEAAEVDPWLKGLIEQGRYIRNIGIAPDNRISYIYPLADNESALGLYYPDLPEQWPAVKKVIDERSPLLAGPLELKQGGQGLIYRVPVYLDADTYWGIISTVIDADALLARTQQAADNRQLDIALVKLNNQDNPQLFFGNQALLNNAVTELKVTIPGALVTLCQISRWTDRITQPPFTQNRRLATCCQYCRAGLSVYQQQSPPCRHAAPADREPVALHPRLCHGPSGHGTTEYTGPVAGCQ